MTSDVLIRVVVFALAGSSASLLAQTDLVVNGSFESGLSNWTFSQVNEGSATGTCSYNGVTAPGTETLTSTAGFPATDGSNIVLGSVSSTSGASARSNCTLYQDIAIPAGTGTLTLKFDLGAKAGNDGCINVGAFVGLYSTATVPGLVSASLGGSNTSICTSSPAATLATFTVSKNPATLSGTTVRLAFINVANVNGHEVIGIDNVQLLATPAVPTVTAVNPATGPLAGGNTVTITGTNFTGATAVTFGGIAATSFTVVNATTIRATVPSSSVAGSASVIVTTPGGSNLANTLYSYSSPIPTLGQWGMIGLTALLMLYGWSRVRRLDNVAGAA